MYEFLTKPSDLVEFRRPCIAAICRTCSTWCSTRGLKSDPQLCSFYNTITQMKKLSGFSPSLRLSLSLIRSLCRSHSRWDLRIDKLAEVRNHFQKLNARIEKFTADGHYHAVCKRVKTEWDLSTRIQNHMTTEPSEYVWWSKSKSIIADDVHLCCQIEP